MKTVSGPFLVTAGIGQNVPFFGGGNCLYARNFPRKGPQIAASTTTRRAGSRSDRECKAWAKRVTKSELSEYSDHHVKEWQGRPGGKHKV